MTQSADRLVDVGAHIILLGDDMATQTGLMFSLALWEKYFKP